MEENMSKRHKVLFPLIFAIVAVVGLFYVKWDPYYAKAFVAAPRGVSAHPLLRERRHRPRNRPCKRLSTMRRLILQPFGRPLSWAFLSVR